ncbi:unnamed protein product [Miscanthus lutarioriparius]|uniref:PB1-like domain-containing protein n=1 Tax=Miscanthus lutarioriparius TaxID=422564 RepID=A0A811REZ3_9POAL|nr:unnamed protein product [Miscanthus lutarioriparius]
MDVCDFLLVRFHFNGDFLRNSNGLFYVGGTQAMSYIDRDKLSLPEVVGHLHDHCTVKEGTLLHWLFPGRDMSTGLRALVDDRDAADEASDYEQEMEDNLEDDEIEDEDLQPMSIRKIGSKEVEKQVALIKQFYSSPNKEKEHANNMPGHTYGDEKSDTNSEYMAGDSCSSGDDDEAAQIYRKFRNFKKFKRDGAKGQYSQAGNTHALNSEGGGSSQPAGSQSAAGGNPNAIVVLSNTQKSSTSCTKRKSTSDVSSTQSQKKAKATNSHNIIKSSAHARVSTIPSSSATINLQARVPTSNVNSSVHVQLTGGTTSVRVSAQEPAKLKSKPAPKRSGTAPLLMLPPWQSDKL